MYIRMFVSMLLYTIAILFYRLGKICTVLYIYSTNYDMYVASFIAIYSLYIDAWSRRTVFPKRVHYSLGINVWGYSIP